MQAPLGMHLMRMVKDHMRPRGTRFLLLGLEPKILRSPYDDHPISILVMVEPMRSFGSV